MLAFWPRLEANQQALDSIVSVGLDTEVYKIPRYKSGTDIAVAIIAYNDELVGATRDIACLYKLNAATYRCQGFQREGLLAAHETVLQIHRTCPGTPVLWDAKYTGTPEENQNNAIEAFDIIGADAVTVYADPGLESIKPFFDWGPDRGVFVIGHNSHTGADTFQDLPLKGSGTLPTSYHQSVILAVKERWGNSGNCGVVMGATYPQALAGIRRFMDNANMPILAVGAGWRQGADIERTVRNGVNTNGCGLIMHFSGQIAFAKLGVETYASASDSSEEARRLQFLINDVLIKMREEKAQRGRVMAGA